MDGYIINNAYSTEETLTSKTWIDGKKIYQKTFTHSWGSSGSSSGGVTDIDITNLQIDSIVNGEGVILGSNSSYGKGYYPMTFMNATSSGTANAYKWGINETKTTLTFQMQGDGLSFKMYDCTFTLEYTKTSQ